MSVVDAIFDNLHYIVPIIGVSTTAIIVLKKKFRYESDNNLTKMVVEHKRREDAINQRAKSLLKL